MTATITQFSPMDDDYEIGAPIEADEPLEADKQLEASDAESFSDYATTIGSSTQSLTESIVDYVYENGRRYHKLEQGKYALPNDETEQDRLDLTHHLSGLILKGELYLAPIKKPQHVMDCGTGTGIWALEFGDMHPESEVIGVDLSDIQPRWVAPNVKFEVDDLEKPWTWKENYFDFIHSRHLANGVRDWGYFTQQMFRHCKPNGWVEIQGFRHKLESDDGTADSDAALAEFWRRYIECAKKAGLTFPERDTIVASLEEAGFVDVTVHKLLAPWGAWPKNKRLKYLGAINHLNAETGMEAYGLQLLTRFGGMSVPSAKKLFADALKDLTNQTVHGYQEGWQIYARKPE